MSYRILSNQNLLWNYRKSIDDKEIMKIDVMLGNSGDCN